MALIVIGVSGRSAALRGTPSMRLTTSISLQRSKI
jgi:hypothetical protein